MAFLYISFITAYVLFTNSFEQVAFLFIEIMPIVQSLGWNERDKYLVIRVKKDDQLIQIQKEIKSQLKEKGISVKEQEFIPHISLGRIAPESNIDFNQLDLSTIRVKKIKKVEISLYESLSKSVLL